MLGVLLHRHFAIHTHVTRQHEQRTWHVHIWLSHQNRLHQLAPLDTHKHILSYQEQTSVNAFIKLITVGFSLISNHTKFAIQSCSPFKRREAHTCVNAFAILNCTHAGTCAYMTAHKHGQWCDQYFMAPQLLQPCMH